MPPARPTVCPDRLHPLLRRYASGKTSAAMTLMHLLIETGGQVEQITRIVESTLTRTRAECDETAAQCFGQLRQLLSDHEAGLRQIAALLREGLDHEPAASPERGIDQCRAMFDRLARHSPEAAVALYSLGSPTLLDAATGEVVDKMRAWNLIAPDRHLIEIGCGIGRFQAALAGSVATVVGIDISGEMIAAARRRCAELSNVRFLQCSGRDLSPFDTAMFDLVFAVDSFPYLMQAGGIDLAERHVREAARVLKPEGDLLILNFSYRAAAELDRTDVARLAAGNGFAVIRNGARAFTLWDGLAFHLRRNP